MDHDDDLIARLQALGDKLDERRAHASESAGDLRPGRGRRRSSRLAWAAALIAAVAIVAAAFLAAGRDAGETVRMSSTTTTTTEPTFDPAAVDALAASLRARDDQAVIDCARADATSTSTEPPPDDREYTSVGIGPGCLKGWVRTAAMAGDDLIAVHPTPESTDIIGYWLADVGWITPDEAKAPDFDAALFRAASDANADADDTTPGG